MFMEIFADGEYDRCISDLLDQAPRNAELTIMDLGANVGFFVLRVFDLLSKSGRKDLRLHVISVEASRPVLDQIAPQLPESAKDHRVELIHGVVGLKTGSVTFHHSASSCEGSIFTGKGGAGRTEEIAYVDLDKILPPTRRIDLLKCDIEGAEEQFVGTYPDLLRKIDRLAIEFHHTLCNKATVKNQLRELGLTETLRGREDDWAEVAYWTRAGNP
jgi:FkbM family methyltransferase